MIHALHRMHWIWLIACVAHLQVISRIAQFSEAMKYQEKMKDKKQITYLFVYTSIL